MIGVQISPTRTYVIFLGSIRPKLEGLSVIKFKMPVGTANSAAGAVGWARRKVVGPENQVVFLACFPYEIVQFLPEIADLPYSFDTGPTEPENPDKDLLGPALIDETSENYEDNYDEWIEAKDDDKGVERGGLSSLK